MIFQENTKTSNLLEKAKKSILFNAIRPELVMERGEGSYLWDTEGKKYLDFVGGWAVTCLGHSPTVIKEALAAQASTLVNTSPAFYNKPMIEFAELLTDITCFDRVFFGSSGAEANEGAIKLARKHGMKNLGGANEIITTINSFHGRTLATMSATGKSQWETLFAPRVPGFKHVPFNDIAAFTAAISPTICAVMLELIQGEGGVHSIDPEYLFKIREICDEHGILLIIDEIQTGIGRTGKLFAYEHYGVQADIMTLAKGIGGGFPLSAMLTLEKHNIFDAGDQGGTYCGQPLAMSVGYAVVNEVIKRDLSHNAEIQGNYIMEKLHGLKDAFKLKDIRGKGLLIAFDLLEMKGVELVAECLKEGLLINAPNQTTIRLMPALIVSRDEVDSMLEIIVNVMKKVLI